MRGYVITILGYGDRPVELYIRARRGLEAAQVAAAWERKRGSRCIAVRDARTHELLWQEV